MTLCGAMASAALSLSSTSTRCDIFDSNDFGRTNNLGTRSKGIMVRAHNSPPNTLSPNPPQSVRRRCQPAPQIALVDGISAANEMAVSSG
jgi:hypothetical protein